MCSPDSTKSESMSSSSKEEQDRLQAEQNERLKTIHQLLARQLEYYFSTVNLDKDTYLSTLRNLNDGYVPVSIIANFAKVQALAPLEAALDCVQTAATKYSDLLEIVVIDSDTGKRVVEGEKDEKKKTLIAVGPVSGEPIPMERISTSHGGTAGVGASAAVTPVVTKGLVSTTSSNGVQNTIIFRETPESITEEMIRELFAFEGCPPIESIKQDVQNFWFVTLDTTSRDTMVNVMFRVRTQKFPGGEPVMARLKSLAAPSVSPSPVNFVPTPTQFDPQQVMTMFAPSLMPLNQQNNNNAGSANGSKKKRSNKGRSHKGKNHRQQNGNNNKLQGNKINGGNQSKHVGNNDKAIKKEEKRQEPPKMGEEDFPSLPPSDENSNKKIEVEKVPDQRSDCDDDEFGNEFGKGRNGAGFSDSSSTATTSTASTPNPSQLTIVGGYAAALRKAAPPQPVIKKILASASAKTSSGNKNNVAKNSKQSNNKKGKSGKIDQGLKASKKQQQPEEGDDHPAVNIQPPSWGNGRSFADILSTSQQ